MSKQMTWDNLIQIFCANGKQTTKDRKLNEFKQKRWHDFKRMPVADTTGSDFLELIQKGGQMTQVYLAALQTLALDIGAIGHHILPKKHWPKIHKEQKRAITEAEHRMLVSNLRTWRWKLFLQILWETGAAQADAASFRIEKLEGNVIEYHRQKTGQRAALRVSEELLTSLHSAACGRSTGYFLPGIQKLESKDRAGIFRRACKRVGIEGVTLHSYRYAWAERAFEMGIPERLAMVALGHNSAAIHRAYAKNAKVVAPCLSLPQVIQTEEQPPELNFSQG